MFSHLISLFLFETIQPSYGIFIRLLPEQAYVTTASQISPPRLDQERIPIKTGESIAPVLEASSIYSIDLKSGVPLFVRDIFTRRPIASIGKLVNAMVILDNYQLDEKVTVSEKAARQEGSTMWLRAGEEITIHALLTGMLVNSGNDAAVALAEFDSGTEGAFVKKMNEKARQLGLQNTHFSNAKGFDEAHNYSTAFDTMVFSRAALAYPFIKKTVMIKSGEVRSASGKTKHLLESTNELLENPYFPIIGLKTGKTPLAGQSFVSLTKGPHQHEIITVLLDSPNRFKETKILLDWIFRNYEFPQ